MPAERNPLFHHVDEDGGEDEVDGFIKKQNEDMVALLSDPYDVYEALKSEPVLRVAAAGMMAATDAKSADLDDDHPPNIGRLVCRKYILARS